MSKAGRSDVFGGVAIAAMLVCCGGPLLLAALVALAAGTGLIAAGLVVVGVLGLALAVALGLRYALRRSAIRSGEQPCAECVAVPAGRQRHEKHALPPSA